MRGWQMRAAGEVARPHRWWGGVLRGPAVLPQPQCRERPGVCRQSRGSHSWEGRVWELIWCQIIKNLGGRNKEPLCPPAFYSERC